MRYRVSNALLCTIYRVSNPVTYTLHREKLREREACPHTICWEPQVKWSLRGEYAMFLSHFKQEAAGDARFLKDKLEERVREPVFLDSVDLQDLAGLTNAVRKSDVSS